MFRTIFLQIFIIIFIGNFSYAFNKKHEKEISKAKKLEYTADSLLEKEEYKPAVNNYLNAAMIFEQNKLWVDAVKNYRQTAWCYFKLNKIDSSQNYVNRSLEIYNKRLKQLTDLEKYEESELHYIQARIYLDKREFDSTFSYLERGIKIINELNSTSNSYNTVLAKYFQTYGTSNYYNGNYDISLKYNFQALDIRQKELGKNHVDVLNSYFNIAIIYVVKRDYEKAIQNLRLIISYCKDEDRIWKAISYNYLGIINKRMKEYGKAIEYFEKALAIYQAEGKDPVMTAGIMNNLGEAYSSLEDFDNALKNLKRSLEIRKKHLGETHPFISRNYITIGKYYYQKEKYEEAIFNFLKALEILDKNKSQDKLVKNQLYNLIGASNMLLNKNYEALNYMQKAICELIVGFDYNENLENPELFFERANIINPEYEVFSKSILYENLINKAKIYIQIYEQNTFQVDILEEALNTYKLAFKLLNIIRLEISNEESKYILGETEKSYYNEAIQVSLKLDSLYPEKQYSRYVLEFVDKCKSSSLKDNSYITNALNKSDIPEELKEREKELAKKLAYYNTQINKRNATLEKDTIESYKKKYHKLTVEYDTINNYLKNSYPGYYNLIHSDEFNIESIQSKINENEIILEYFVTNYNILIITVTNKDYEIVNVEIDTTFKNYVSKFYRGIRKVDIPGYIRTNSILYEKLIKPVISRIETKKSLIIIPDDYLFYIPFEAIFTDKNEGNAIDFRNFGYLIKDYEIKYNYSLNLWKFNNEIGKTKNNFIGEFIGLAPVFASNGNLAITSLNDIDTATRSVNIDGVRFSTLKYSKKEIEEISKLFLQNDKSIKSVFYDQATEGNFKNNASGYKYIHIATHGFSDKNNPNLSGLAFYASESNDSTNSTRKEDGLLYSEEISSLDLNADLVVLSACETGIGKLVKSEGLIAITRSFIDAGTCNIIHSLWNVMDRSTSELMVEFYKQVLSGKSYSQSLREAKIKMINEINTCHPKIWCSFVLVGI